MEDVRKGREMPQTPFTVKGRMVNTWTSNLWSGSVQGCRRGEEQLPISKEGDVFWGSWEGTEQGSI